jgi:very-short-patch-repair endonuclease
MEPFIGSAAVRRGILTRHVLARDYRALYRDAYIPRGLELTALVRAQAAWLSTGATLCGLSAAAAWGTKWLDPAAPAEVLRSNRHRQRGMVVRSYQVGDDELSLSGSLPVTTAARTAFDIGRSYPLGKAVPILDALLAATGVNVSDVARVAERWPGVRGVRRLESVLGLVDSGAESPQESRLRLILVRGGLPRPETQIVFRDLRIRVDMGWREWKVAVEYDGIQHWADPRQRAWDIERIDLLEAAGWVVVRVSAAMLRRPEVVIERVRTKLRAAGCPL